MIYDPNNVKVSWGGNDISDFSEVVEVTSDIEKIPLDLTIELKDIGKVGGTVYLTQEQFNVFNAKYKGGV